MFLVMLLKESAKVKVGNCEPALESDITMDWADGMIGVMPVFGTREDAEKYAGDRQIIELEKV